MYEPFLNNFVRSKYYGALFVNKFTFPLISFSVMKMSSEKNYKPWNSKSDAAKHLEELLVTGELDPNTPPKKVYVNDPMFHRYNLNSFRAAYAKLKSKLGIHVRGPVGKSLLQLHFQKNAP